jgi:hypothetical protein
VQLFGVGTSLEFSSILVLGGPTIARGLIFIVVKSLNLIPSRIGRSYKMSDPVTRGSRIVK